MGTGAENIALINELGGTASECISSNEAILCAEVQRLHKILFGSSSSHHFVDIKAVSDYFLRCKAIQEKHPWPAKAEFPPVLLSKLDRGTRAVLTTYKEMATVWHRAGGKVPDPREPELMELLRTMGCNGLSFVQISRGAI